MSKREGPRRNWYIFRLGTIIKFPQQFEKVFPLSQKGKKFRRRRKQIIFLAFAKSAFFSTIAEKKIVDDDNTTDDIFIAVDKTHAIAPYNKTVFTIWIYETVVVALASGFSCSFSAITFLQCFGKNCLLPPPLSFFFSSFPALGGDRVRLFFTLPHFLLTVFWLRDKTMMMTYNFLAENIPFFKLITSKKIEPFLRP